MNKSNTIVKITSDVLDRYRNSIPRKAFIQALERVTELTLGPSGSFTGPARPGMTLLQSTDLTTAQKALLLSGSCPPFPTKLDSFPCQNHDCQTCWLSWLNTGKPPQVEEDTAT